MGIKVAQTSTDSLGVLVYRYDFAFAAMIILMLFRVIKIDIKGKPKKKLLTTAAFLCGIYGSPGNGTGFATSVEGSIYFALVPIIVKIIASIFLGEKSSWLENCFVCLTVAALVVMLAMRLDGDKLQPGGSRSASCFKRVYGSQQCFHAVYEKRLQADRDNLYNSFNGLYRL